MKVTVDTRNGLTIDIEMQEIIHSSDNGNEYQYTGVYEIDSNEKYEVEGWRNRNEPLVSIDSITISNNIITAKKDIAEQLNSQV